MLYKFLHIINASFCSETKDNNIRVLTLNKQNTTCCEVAEDIKIFWVHVCLKCPPFLPSQELSYRDSLHCVQSAFTILTGQGDVFNIDPLAFYRHLYRTLYYLHVGEYCS